jgi:hypothetical protein
MKASDVMSRNAVTDVHMRRDKGGRPGRAVTGILAAAEPAFTQAATIAVSVLVMIVAGVATRQLDWRPRDRNGRDRRRRRRGRGRPNRQG